MKIKRIEHIAVAVEKLSAMHDLLENKLGLKLAYEEELPQYNTRIAMYPVGETYLEILESDAAGTEVSNWIAEHGESLFHICLEVDDIDSALDELRTKGVQLIDKIPRAGHADSRIAFLDPQSTNNILIELAEFPSAAGESGDKETATPAKHAH